MKKAKINLELLSKLTTLSKILESWPTDSALVKLPSRSFCNLGSIDFHETRPVLSREGSFLPKIKKNSVFGKSELRSHIPLNLGIYPNLYLPLMASYLGTLKSG